MMGAGFPLSMDQLGFVGDVALGLGTTALSAHYDQKAASHAHKKQVSLMQMNQKFYNRMRHTAYQATVKDLRRAGLNPMLAVSRGPTTGPVMGTPTAAHAAGIGGRAVGAGLKAFNSRLERRIMKQQEWEAAARTDNQSAQATEARIRTNQHEAATKLIETQQRRELVALELERLALPSAQARARWDSSPAGQKAHEIRRALEMAPGIGVIPSPLGKARRLNRTTPRMRR